MVKSYNRPNKVSPLRKKVKARGKNGGRPRQLPDGLVPMKSQRALSYTEMIWDALEILKYKNGSTQAELWNAL